MKKSTKKDRSILPIYSYTLFGKKYYVVRDREIVMCLKKCISAICENQVSSVLIPDEELHDDWIDLQLWSALVPDEKI